MSPINITNLLVKIASNNNMVNKSANKNINQQGGLLQNQGSLLPQQNIPRPAVPNIVQQQNIPQQNVVQQQFVQQQNIPQQNIVQQQFVQQQNIPQQNIVQQQFVQQQNIPQQNIAQQQFVQQQNIASNLLGKNVQNSQILTAKNVSSRLANVNVRNQNINYVKEMMNLPQDMKDVLSLVQKNAQSITASQGQNALLTLGNINIKNLTQLIQNGSKLALNQVINANIAQNLSKAERKQIEEAISYLNASSSSQESQTQALKNFMLLYLPWLPLEEGTDFELDFTFSEGSEEDDENILNIVIVTKNYGEIHILIILKAMNSFEIYIQCCKNFPKRKLMKLIGEDENKYTLKSNLVFEEQTNFEPKNKPKEAKITLSHVKEISPFLLLIANSIIKNILLLDSNAVV